ncbi:MAG: hypothetical protein ACXU86_01325, partial [Archangium sp.]
MSGEVVRFEASEEFARRMDAEDPLRSFREEFFFPAHGGEPAIYLVGNSLGLQPAGIYPGGAPSDGTSGSCRRWTSMICTPYV